MVQLEYGVSDEARALPVPKGHASSIEGGTVLECLTRFAIMRLQEQGYLIRTGKNQFKHTGKKYIVKVSQRDVSAALVSFKILVRDQPVEKALNLLGDK